MRCILGSYHRYSNHRVALLAGGVGGARMARALRAVVEPGLLSVIINVGDDSERYGVHVSADPDTVLYTLANKVGPHGWGRSNDTTRVMDALTDLGYDTSFTLGDKDLAVCMARTDALRRGERLSEVTADLADRLGVTDVNFLPATDDPLRTWVQTGSGDWLAFQEYFVDRGHEDDVAALAFHGSESADPAPGVVEAISGADTVVIAPSNPPLSIWPILAIDEITEAVRSHPNVATVSPLFGGTPLKGPADRVMLGVGLSGGTLGILEAYRGLMDRLYIDDADAADTTLGNDFSVQVIPADTNLTGPDLGVSLASAILEGS